jgi:hypothetical protein
LARLSITLHRLTRRLRETLGRSRATAVPLTVVEDGAEIAVVAERLDVRRKKTTAVGLAGVQSAAIFVIARLPTSYTRAIRLTLSIIRTKAPIHTGLFDDNVA